MADCTVDMDVSGTSTTRISEPMMGCTPAHKIVMGSRGILLFTSLRESGFVSTDTISFKILTSLLLYKDIILLYVVWWIYHVRLHSVRL